MSRLAPSRELAAVEAVLGAVGCQFGAGSVLFRELAAVEAVLGAVGCQFGGQSVRCRPPVSVVAA